MHSWVGYEVVQILLKYGLSPKLRTDLNEWSPQLYTLFSYFQESGRSAGDEKILKMLTILYDGTDHCSYFEKISYGRMKRVVKMDNMTIPMVILTWLRQLQEYFFEQPENSLNWNDYGRYCNVPAKYAVQRGIYNVHMSKATDTNPEKITSLQCIPPNKKDSKKVVKSLLDWADLILLNEDTYVKEIANKIDNKKKTTLKTPTFPARYEMTRRSYKKKETKKGDNTGEIEKYTPEDQQHKSPELLMSIVSNFMIDAIDKFPKKLTQKNIDLINKTNRASACLVEYVNKVQKEEVKFTSINEMRNFMAKKVEEQTENKEEESSEDDSSEDYNYGTEIDSDED